MSTGNDDMNARLRRRPDSAAQARLRARLMDTDPDGLLDELAREVQRDPDALARLDAGTRERLGAYVLSQRALTEELAARAERLAQAGGATPDGQSA